MYLSDFNMMLDGKMIDCFSEISLDKNIINDLNEKLKENNSLYNINNNISDAEENTKQSLGILFPHAKTRSVLSHHFGKCPNQKTF